METAPFQKSAPDSKGDTPKPRKVQRKEKPGMTRIAELIETVLWTGFMAGERPVSMILIAPPGAGKSSMLESFDSDYSPFTSDATAREVSKILREKKNATHLIIGDLMSVMRHKKGTTDLTINLLSQLSGDTLSVDSFTGDKAGKRMGIITAIPPEDLKGVKIRKALEAGGFMSRFLIANYAYTNDTVGQIHKYIREGRYVQDSHARVLRVGPPVREIKMSPEIAQEIEKLALIVKRDPIGARAHHYMRTLAMGIAARQASRKVLARHIEILARMSQFFNKTGVML